MNDLKNSDTLSGAGRGSRQTATRESRQSIRRLRVVVSESADSGCLLRLLSVLHARGIPVVDMQYTLRGDGRYQMTATVQSEVAKFATLLASLGRAIHVLGVTSDEDELVS